MSDEVLIAIISALTSAGVFSFIQYLISRRDKKKEDDSISPGLMAFLDAETHEEKLDVLYRIRSSLDDDTVNAIALSLDTEIRDGSIAERYEEIRNYILTMMKYEGARLRN